MSIWVSDFMSPTEWQVQHDEAGHGGTIDPATIIWTKDIDNIENHNFLIVKCPECDSVSTHPVGGGAQPQLVQEMFIRKIDAEGCVCGAVIARSTQAAIDHVKELVTAMDGEDRWQVDEDKLLGELRSD